MKRYNYRAKEKATGKQVKGSINTSYSLENALIDSISRLVK